MNTGIYLISKKSLANVKESLTPYLVHQELNTQSIGIYPVNEILAFEKEVNGSETLENFYDDLESISIEELKVQIKSSYQNVLSEINGLFRAFVKFDRPESEDSGILDCDFFFFVSPKLYFNIDYLYEKTRSIRDYFEDKLDVNIFYHYYIFHGQELEEDVQEEALEVYFETTTNSTASEF